MKIRTTTVSPETSQHLRNRITSKITHYIKNDRLKKGEANAARKMKEINT